MVLSKREGIIPALNLLAMVAEVLKKAPTMPKDLIVIVNMSGRGDKDPDTVMSIAGGIVSVEQVTKSLSIRPYGFMPMALGYPTVEKSIEVIKALVEEGADLLELVCLFQIRWLMAQRYRLHKKQLRMVYHYPVVLSWQHD